MLIKLTMSDFLIIFYCIYCDDSLYFTNIAIGHFGTKISYINESLLLNTHFYARSKGFYCFVI